MNSSRSLIDILIEPAPFTKILAVFLVCNFVPESDTKLLIDSLPKDCAFIRRKGLVNILPPMVKSLLDIPHEYSGVENTSHEHSINRITSTDCLTTATNTATNTNPPNSNNNEIRHQNTTNSVSMCSDLTTTNRSFLGLFRNNDMNSNQRRTEFCGSISHENKYDPNFDNFDAHLINVIVKQLNRYLFIYFD